jgi:hypothetical protein
MKSDPRTATMFASHVHQYYRDAAAAGISTETVVNRFLETGAPATRVSKAPVQALMENTFCSPQKPVRNSCCPDRCDLMSRSTG